jgi:hypothetical protein
VRFLFREGNPVASWSNSSDELIYTEDIKTTGIVVVEGGSVNPERIGKWPAVAISREGARLVSMTIGSEQSHTFRGTITKKEQLAFQLVATVVAHDDIQAENVAYYIASRTFFCSDLLCQEGFYSIGTEFVITPPGPAIELIQGDGSDIFQVRVVFPARVLISAQIDPVNLETLRRLWVSVRGSNGITVGQIKVEET